MLGLVLGGGACDFNQDLSTYCAASKACACDGSSCCVTLDSICDDQDPCCGELQCVEGFCELPGFNPDASYPPDAGGADAGDAGPPCGKNGSPCSGTGDCCSATCQATTCCAPAGYPCGFVSDCCDPNASCGLLQDGGVGCIAPVSADGGVGGGVDAGHDAG